MKRLDEEDYDQVEIGLGGIEAARMARFALKI